MSEHYTESLISTESIYFPRLLGEVLSINIPSWIGLEKMGKQKLQFEICEKDCTHLQATTLNNNNRTEFLKTGLENI